MLLLVWKALIVEPMNEELERFHGCILDGDGLVLSFCKTASKRCAEVLRMVNKDSFVDDKALLLATYDDGREACIRCAESIVLILFQSSHR